MRPIPFRSLGILFTAAFLIFGGSSLAAADPLRVAFDPKNLPPDLHTLTVQNVPIVYSDQGKGEPLIILPSYPFSPKFWADLSTRLSGSLRVIVLEPPGLRDPSSMGGDFSSQHLLYIYRDFIKALGVGSVHIMGEGEGGGLAVALGHHFPEMIGGVVSIDGFESVNWSESFGGVLKLFEQSASGGFGMLLSSGSMKYGEQPASRETLEKWLGPVQEENQKKAVHDRFKAFASDVQESYILAMLPNFNRPFLLLRAENDQLLPDSEKYAQRTRSQIRKVTVDYQVVPKAGHFAFLDQPDKVAELIRTFLSNNAISKTAPRTN
ncbi:MAG TPA: alpha/beta hydrolase [Nitrospiria bacterium]|nr:alpha/beta hydrolase [Nitrospiria bacterium]